MLPYLLIVLAWLVLFVVLVIVEHRKGSPTLRRVLMLVDLVTCLILLFFMLGTIDYVLFTIFPDNWDFVFDMTYEGSPLLGLPLGLTALLLGAWLFSIPPVGFLENRITIPSRLTGGISLVLGLIGILCGYQWFIIRIT